ncbi:hypothetical protein TPHA_0J02180 [Tetrapisispora phaffii CBS 4417]|uniref:Spc7 kinetochore protein domain-containing protein n=1 Tax=Tetrapisispora phaffii (strain ATCC 24235 / CBS 4417 / NBRC 1672 / NRRL Y-8282 / UCD 70-5) TaxID=1071381 RepID=G8BYU6_TETPH|nr:hypothetical protein TPHA_0J02180 [Tetrapisispora phaffii CBS 4417]CCE65038.1 hypothetical protein TPHA_0J02180 [Tetrapisispora phaffii CBS 4417]
MSNKSILKSTQERLHDENDSYGMNNSNNNTLPSMGFSKVDLLDGNNTTSNINTSGMQSKLNRRVSFAPDVTLHSFDFVPEQRLKVREPRRRIPVELLPTSSQELNTDVNMVTSTQQPDMSLDLTEPVRAAVQISSNRESNGDEFTMEMTELFVQDNGELAEKLGDKDMLVDDKLNETMDFTKPNGIVEEFQQTIDTASSLEQKKTDNNITMEFTGVFNERGNTEEHQLSFHEVNAVSQGEALEMTEVFSAATSKLAATNEVTTAENDDSDMEKSISVAMDFTMVQPNLQSPTKLDSKRRKLAEDGAYATNDTSEPPVLSASVPLVDSQTDDIVSDIERMSPIAMSSLEHEISLNKPIIVSPNAKIVETKETTDNLESNRHSIKDFLRELNLDFDQYNTVSGEEKQDIIFKLSQLSETNGVPINQLYNFFYIDTPIFEMNTFIITELLKKISNSKSILDDLDNQTISNPPPIIAEYYASDLSHKQSISQKMLTIKNYSGLLAQRGWYEWRIQHLLGLQNVLQENITILNEELEKISEDLENVKNIKNRTDSIRASIRREIRLLKELPAAKYNKESTLNDKINIENLKQELMANGIKLEEYTTLKTKKEGLLLYVKEMNDKITSVRKEISALAADTMKGKVFTTYDISRLKMKFSLLQNITNVKFVSMVNSTLQIKLNIKMFPVINVEMRNFQITQITENIYLEEGSDPFISQYVNQLSSEIALKNNKATLMDVLSNLLKQLESDSTFLKQYISFQLLYNIKLVEHMGVFHLLFANYDVKTDNKMRFLIPAREFINLGSNNMGKLNIKFEAIRGEAYGKDEALALFIKKINRSLPWINDTKVNLLYL